MRLRKRTPRLILLSALFALGASSSVALACAIASDGTSVTIVEENVLIVSDPTTNMQHLIRQAAFHTNAADFGFLVPTPTKPELAEADNRVFGRLAQATKPQHVYKSKLDWRPTLIEMFFPILADGIFSNVDSSLPTGSPGDEVKVEVVHQQAVAGYDASVLRADDPQALMEWLKENGYQVNDDLTEWVKPYIEKRWMITAFKFAKKSSAAANVLKTNAIRMSFVAKQPFFPYREPPRKTFKSNTDRMLRIYLVAPTKLEGSLEDKRLDWRSNAKTPYATPNSELTLLLHGAVPQQSLPKNGWLTVLEDETEHRLPGGDLVFATSNDQTRIIPPPIVHYMGTTTIPLCLDVLGVLLVVVWTRRMIRTRLATTHAVQVPTLTGHRA